MDPFVDVVDTPQEASDIIFNTLNSSSPCMIARYGSTEMNILQNYISIQNPSHSWKKYITGQSFAWWWHPLCVERLRDNAGFFPLDVDSLSKFCELMISDSKEIDILGSWLEAERLILNNHKRVKKIRLLYLEPYWADRPWTMALKGKKVLVIHPFASLIEKQYFNNRKFLFKNPSVLPDFELQTLQTVQTFGGISDTFDSWFDALHYMEEEIDKKDFEIALIACGSYGFPLAAHIKRCGKKSIHLGGALQLLFGIKGKRWENPRYGIERFGREGVYSELFNEYWCRPNNEEISLQAKKVEGGCYW